MYSPGSSGLFLFSTKRVPTQKIVIQIQIIEPKSMVGDAALLVALYLSISS